MILIAKNVLNGIAGRSKQLQETLLKPSTRRLPGYEAYERALKNRTRPRTADRSTEADKTDAGSAAD